MNKPLDPRVVVPASDDAYSRWQTEYAEQIGVDSAVANRSDRKSTRLNSSHT